MQLRLVDLPAGPPGGVPAMKPGEDRARLRGGLTSDRAIGASVQLHDLFNHLGAIYVFHPLVLLMFLCASCLGVFVPVQPSYILGFSRE